MRNGTVSYLPSRLLTQGDVIAGFSTRTGGDAPTSLAKAAGFSTEKLFMVTQVHSVDRIVVCEGDTPAMIEPREADALLTTDRGVALAVRTADCVPVLLSSPGGEIIAAVHAGWRGYVAGIVGEAIDAMIQSGALKTSDLRAAVGPAIDGCCFEVGREVADAVETYAGTREVIRPGPRGRPHVELRDAVRRTLLSLGLQSERIELVGPCTRCASSLLHSYRREGAGKGRQLSFIFLKQK